MFRSFLFAGVLACLTAFPTSSAQARDWDDYWDDYEDAVEDYWDDYEDAVEDQIKFQRRAARRGYYGYGGYYTPTYVAPVRTYRTYYTPVRSYRPVYYSYPTYNYVSPYYYTPGVSVRVNSWGYHYWP